MSSYLSIKLLPILIGLFWSLGVYAALPTPVIIDRIRIPHEEPSKLITKKYEYLPTVSLKVPPTPPNYASGDTVWDRLAQCESGGNWAINTGNGYYGGLQFNLQTWQSNGGTGYPHQNSREEQIRVAENLRANRGFAPWPACSAKLGLN